MSLQLPQPCAWLPPSLWRLTGWVACVQMTYCGRLGEESSELITYLQAVPGVTPIQPGANPATWCAAAGVGFYCDYCPASRAWHSPHPARCIEWGAELL